MFGYDKEDLLGKTTDLIYADREIKVDLVDHSIVIGTSANQVRKIFLPHESEALAGLWDTDRRNCAYWLPLVQKHGETVHGN